MLNPWYDMYSAFPLALIGRLSDQVVEMSEPGNKRTEDESMIASMDEAIIALTALCEDEDEDSEAERNAQQAIRWVGDNLYSLDFAADISREYGQSLIHWGENANSYVPDLTYEEWTETLKTKGGALLAYAADENSEKTLTEARLAYYWTADHLSNLWD